MDKQLAIPSNMSGPIMPIQPDVLTTGLKVFATEAALIEWLEKPAIWAHGKTPADLIANGMAGDVVAALLGIGYGNFL